jgi:hypothetical protein
LANKKKADQLDGVLADGSALYQHVKSLDVLEKHKIHMISEHMKISNDLKEKVVMSTLSKEINFFDDVYFKNKDHP